MAVCLVLGASGAVGRFLVPHLLDAGHQVLALSRAPRANRGDLRWLVGDLYGAMPSLPPLDAIFSLGPLDGLAQWLSRASPAGAPRVVALSSMSAHSKRDSPDPAERALAARLRSAEQAVEAAASTCGMTTTILRPTLIYGAGIDRSLTPIVRAAQRWRVFPRIPAATGLRQPVHAADLADACLAAWRTPSDTPRCYAVGGGERLSFDTLLDRVRASLSLRTLSVPIPLPAISTAIACARLMPRWRGISAAAIGRLRVDLVADNSAASADLDWSPRTFHPDAACWRATPLA